MTIRTQGKRRATQTRQMYLLLAFANRHIEGMRKFGQPLGFVPTHTPPSCIQIAPGLTIDDPGGIGMANVRGLQRKGLVEEPAKNFFYISDTGRIAAELMVKRLIAEHEKNRGPRRKGEARR